MVPRLRNPGVQFKCQAHGFWLQTIRVWIPALLLTTCVIFGNLHHVSRSQLYPLGMVLIIFVIHRAKGSSKWDSTASLQISWVCSMLSCYNVDERKKNQFPARVTVCVELAHSPLPVSAQVLSGCSCFLPHPKGVRARWIGVSKLDQSECRWVCDGAFNGRASSPGPLVAILCPELAG